MHIENSEKEEKEESDVNLNFFIALEEVEYAMRCDGIVTMILIGEKDIKSFISVISILASVFPGSSDTVIR